jgi:hypothetical protein
LSAATVSSPVSSKSEAEHLHALSLLALAPERASEALDHFAALNNDEREELLSLAESHHVVVRALGAFLCTAGDMHPLARWAADTIAGERHRISAALDRLSHICAELESHAIPVVVMKSLDHFPDLGSDLDLYTCASADELLSVMQFRMAAKREPRSWGDRLANKWNFRVPGLQESVEVHAQRLGQTGEHTRLGQRVISRRMPKQAGPHSFLVPAPEERVIIATLQRMYRHFYFRVCDVVNTAAMADSGTLDYGELERAARESGIWPGVAAYLKICSDYVERYRGRPLALGKNVLATAEFGGETLSVRARFLRVPMVPQGASLYTQQVTTTALRGDVPATFRLTLLPPLASAAALAYRITGSDKGIW